MFCTRKQLAIIAMATGLMLPLASRADDKTPATPANQGNVGNNASAAGSLDAGDQQFVLKAANGGMAEVKLGQLATQRAQNPDVKKLGQKMVDDHSKANDQLKQLAQKKNITLPSDVKGEEKEHFEKMEKMTNADFDRHYVQMMIEDHQKDVAEFRKEAQEGKDADLKAWAAQTLPTLEEHARLVQQTAKTIGVEGGARTAGDRQGPDAANAHRSSGSASPQQPGPGNQDKKDNTSGPGTAQPIPRDNK